MLQIKNNIGGGGGFYPSVLITGLYETDTVSMIGQGKTYTPKWINNETIVNPIPDGYTGLEYIQSSGTQYINTGIKCDNLNLYSEIVGNFTSISTEQWMGCEDSNNSTNMIFYFICAVYNSNFVFQYGSGGKEVTFTADTNTHSFILDGANKIAKIDNTQTSLEVDKHPNNNIIFLFGRNSKGTFKNGCNFKMQRATFKNGDTLLFNGIPCKRNSDSAIGLYDTVSQTFFANSGTGTFTAGAEKDWSTTEGLKGWLFEKITKLGRYEITATDGTNTTTKEVLIDASIEYEIDMVLHFDIVSWSNGTDEQIAAMVAAADEGLIDLSDYWSVGDQRRVTLSAMAATIVGESHAEQIVTMVLMNTGGKTLANATPSGRTECSFIVGMKNGLAETGYMNSSNTNGGGWEVTARRLWCNNVFKNAIPSTLQSIFKPHFNTTANGSGSTTVTSTDYFALPAEKEVFGSNSYANSTAETSFTQFDYYKTSANRIKKAGDSGSANYWCERSPYNGNNNRFCDVDSNGSAYYSNASSTYLISPFGCI